MTTATNTLSQLQSQLDIIGNNLANFQTHGYKASDAKFQEMLYNNSIMTKQTLHRVNHLLVFATVQELYLVNHR